jgi:hypothetical protein
MSPATPHPFIPAANIPSPEPAGTATDPAGGRAHPLTVAAPIAAELAAWAHAVAAGWTAEAEVIRRRLAGIGVAVELIDGPKMRQGPGFEIHLWGSDRSCGDGPQIERPADLTQAQGRGRVDVSRNGNGSPGREPFRVGCAARPTPAARVKSSGTETTCRDQYIPR